MKKWIKDNGLSVILLCIGIGYVALCVGCQPRESDYGSETEIGYSVVKIDGCEYILWKPFGNQGGLAHKGNCTNEIHIYNTEEGIPVFDTNYKQIGVLRK